MALACPDRARGVGCDPFRGRCRPATMVEAFGLNQAMTKVRRSNAGSPNVYNLGAVIFLPPSFCQELRAGWLATPPLFSDGLMRGRGFTESWAAWIAPNIVEAFGLNQALT